jgi:hypothetical protein
MKKGSDPNIHYRKVRTADLASQGKNSTSQRGISMPGHGVAILTLSDETISSPGLVVVLAPHAARSHMLALAARLARRGALQVLDAGNRFNAYEAARFLRGQGAEGFREALERTRVARAFTPFQMLALLQATPAGPAPSLVLDLLSTFYDESLPHTERRRTLELCAVELRRLSKFAPVVVSVRPPPPPEPDPQGLVDIIQQAADQVLFFEELAPPSQLTLF